MLERAIPSSSERLPVIGLGTWRTFDPPKITDAALAPIEGTVAAFVQAGGRVIDTSPMYGKAQTITGLVTTKLAVNQDLFIATKVWTTGHEAAARRGSRCPATSCGTPWPPSSSMPTPPW